MSVLSCSRSLKPWPSLPTLCLALAGLTLPHPADAQTAVLTQNNDNARTGADTAETALTPATVSSGSFGKLFTISGLDSNVNGQLLYVPDVTINGAAHNALYFSTSNNSDGSPCSVYAYDADTGTQLWHTALPASARFTTSTPVIDPVARTMYVLTKSTNDNGPTYLRAFDITSGVQKASVQVQASAPGTGDGSVGGRVYFDGNPGNGTFHANDRAGLLLLNGVVYISFAYNTDGRPYHGWILGYEAASLTQRYVFCTTPNGNDGGIWMSGKGLVADRGGDIYCSVGNGTFDANTGGPDYGMCYLRLSPDLKVLDYFSPYDQLARSNSDLDTGNSGPVGIPGTTKLFAGATKFGTGFLFDSTDMGKFVGPNKPATPGVDGVGNVVRRLDGLSSNDNVSQNPISWSAGATRNVYLWPSGSDLEQMVYDPALGDFRQASSTGTNPGTKSPYPAGVTLHSSGLSGGGPLAVSSDATGNGVLWAVNSHDSGSGTLYALDATDVSRAPLWSGPIGSTGHFQFPTVVNGKVYVPTGSAGIVAYGLTTPPGPAQPVYRLYANGDEDHLYTTNTAEENNAVAADGYALEGVIGYAPTQGSALGLQPVFRLYNPATGEHFLTQNADERDFVSSVLGYRYELVAFNVFSTPGPKTAPLYRLYSPTWGRHFYTTSQGEHDYLVQSGYWADEGLLGYLNTSP